MKRIFCFIAAMIVGLSAMLVTGCGPMYQTNYSYKPPKSFRGRRCVNRCLSDKGICENNCNLVHQACRMEANAEAEPAYRAYLHQERRAGRTPFQTIGDFADYSNCGGDCGCGSNYNGCFTNCGGTIILYRQCVAFCNKAKQ